MKLSKKTWIIGGIVIIVIGFSAYSFFSNKKPVEYTTTDVTRGTLLQTVSETGTITPAKEIELNFLNAGKLAKINVKVGDQVLPDQILGEIDHSNLDIKQQEALASLNVSQANVRQAQSSYDSARREYNKVSASLNEAVKQAEKTKADLEDRGASTITTYEQAITTAETNLNNTKSTYQKSIDNKAASLKTTIQNKLASATTSLDSMKRLFNDSELQSTFSILNPGFLTSAKGAHSSGVTLVSQATNSLDYDATELALNKVFEALGYTFNALESTVTTSQLTQAELDAHKASVDGQTTITSSSISALQTAKQALGDARLAYDTNVLSAEQGLSQAKVNYDNALLTARNAVSTAHYNRDQQLSASQTRVDNAQASLSIAQAQVAQANANLELVKNQVSDNYLKSPIKGVITKINYEIGEQVTQQKAFLSVLTENNYQIEVDISETDIAKIKINDTADIDLDAFGPDVKFTGKVYFIEPAATVIQGVTYYKVKISFDPKEQPVKPGMTASAVILTDKRENVLMMPERAVVQRNGDGNIVRILQTDNTVKEEPVTVGISGDNGMIEVLSGVKEGDKVVTFVKDPNKK